MPPGKNALRSELPPGLGFRLGNRWATVRGLQGLPGGKNATAFFVTGMGEEELQSSIESANDISQNYQSLSLKSGADPNFCALSSGLALRGK